MKCFDCGQDGHIAPNCPNGEIDVSGKPLWCGVCDERTRLLGLDEVHRCPACHPLRNRMLKQHRKCPHCHMTVHQWDNEECGSHSSPVAADKRLEKEHIDAVIKASAG